MLSTLEAIFILSRGEAGEQMNTEERRFKGNGFCFKTKKCSGIFNL
jgi:hypothetical protein